MKIRAILVVCLSMMFLACSGNKLGQSALSGEGGEGEEHNGVGICHVDGQGRYHEIWVSESAITWLPTDGKLTGHPTAKVGEDGNLVGVSYDGLSGTGGHHTGDRTGHVDVSSATHPCDCFTAAEGGPVLDPEREGCCGKEGAYCDLGDEDSASSSESDPVLVKCCAEGLTCQKVEPNDGSEGPAIGKCLPEATECSGAEYECWDDFDCCADLECYIPPDSGGQGFCKTKET